VLKQSAVVFAVSSDLFSTGVDLRLFKKLAAL
jgi:hypothetical protein